MFLLQHVLAHTTVTPLLLYCMVHFHLLCSNKDRVRLVMLYALRFEAESSRVDALMDFLQQAGVRSSNPALYAAAQGILQYGGSEK